MYQIAQNITYIEDISVYFQFAAIRGLRGFPVCLTFIDPGNFLSVILTFYFKRYGTNCLADNN